MKTEDEIRKCLEVVSSIDDGGCVCAATNGPHKKWCRDYGVEMKALADALSWVLGESDRLDLYVTDVQEPTDEEWAAMTATMPDDMPF